MPGMLKTSIFNANAGNGKSESQAMHDYMAAYGMDLDKEWKWIMKVIVVGY